MPEETDDPTFERLGAGRTDRRKRSRSGRRASDPRSNWRRGAWLFAGYALIVTLRSLPAALKKKFSARSTMPTPS